jgi:Domain of unknown function (DUF5666)
MRARLRFFAKPVLCGAMALSLPGMLRAQDPQEGFGRGEGRGQFAGGHMVRGTVTAVASDHLTVKTDAGEEYQVTISPNTRLNKDRQPVKVTDIKAGDSVGAMGVLDAPTKTVHAVGIIVMDAEQVKRMRENLGKTYIAGKVTAIDLDGLKLTVMRADNVSQVIAVDDGTSFRRGGRMMMSMMNGTGPVEGGSPGGGPNRGPGNGNGPGGGESIIFADIKVGDMVAGPGALKNGVFVPTQLGVTDPSHRRQRPRGGETPDNTGAAPRQADSAAPQ